MGHVRIRKPLKGEAASRWDIELLARAHAISVLRHRARPISRFSKRRDSGDKCTRPRHGHDCRDAAEPPERESGANGSVFQPSGSRKELCREHRSSSAHEGRDRRIEVAIDSRTSERIYSRETHLNMVRRSALRNPELVNLAGGLGPIGRPPAISRTRNLFFIWRKKSTQGPISSVVRLAAAFVVRARRGRESGWTTAQSPGVPEKCGKPTPSSRFDAMSLRS